MSFERPGGQRADERVGTPARVLVVCTGNISRSPAAERLLRAGLDDSVRVESAGVAALVGAPIDPPVAGFLWEQGAEPTGFAARQVDERMIRDADLVLTLTRAHRAHVLDLAPAAVRRTFTLREFVRVLESLELPRPLPGADAGGRLRALLPLATAGRALAPRASADGDDVPDPYGRGPAAYASALSAISGATGVLVRILRG